jgi:hypothetical protein
MCTLDADHPFIAPGPNDMRGRELLLLEKFDLSLPIIFYSMPCVPGAVKMLGALSLISYAAAMNTLANHGYISRKYGALLCSNCVLLILSRSGITSFEEIIRGTGEAFNIDPLMASGMAALNLVRISMFRPIFLSHLSTKAHPGKSFRGQNFHRRSLPIGTSAAGSDRWTRDTGNSKTWTGRRLAVIYLVL